MVTGSQHILVMWQNHFFQLFSVHGVGDFRKTEIHRAQPIVAELHDFEVEMTNEKYKVTSPGTDQIQQHWFCRGVEQFAMRYINLFILFGIRMNCQRNGRSQSLCLFLKILIKQTVVTIEAYHICQLLTKHYPTSCYQG